MHYIIAPPLFSQLFLSGLVARGAAQEAFFTTSTVHRPRTSRLRKAARKSQLRASGQNKKEVQGMALYAGPQAMKAACTKRPTRSHYDLATGQVVYVKHEEKPQALEAPPQAA